MTSRRKPGMRPGGLGRISLSRTAAPGRGLDALLGPVPKKRRLVIPKLSEAEELFALQLRAEGFDVATETIMPTPRVLLWVRQFDFHGARRWRFDFAAPAIKVAVEVEGAAHRIRERWMAGLERQRYEAAFGWKVFRFTPNQIREGRAIAFVRALRLATWDTTDPRVLEAIEDQARRGRP